MDDKFMYNPNINEKNYPFCRLQLVVKTFRHLMNQPIKIQYSPQLCEIYIDNYSEAYLLGCGVNPMTQRLT